MTRIFVLDDQRHAELQGEYADGRAVLAELERRAALPCHEEPNRPPCTSWKTCGRLYEVIELDAVNREEICRYEVLEVEPQKAEWRQSGRERLTNQP